MNPDSPETRIGRLEQKVAKLEQRVDDGTTRTDQRLSELSVEVHALAPLVISHARMEIQIQAALDEAKKARTELGSLRTYLDTREDKQREERKADRRWLIGTVLLASGLIIAAIQLLVGG